MANDIQKFFGGHQLPQKRDQLSQALAGFSSGKNALLGKALLRLSKQTGQWVFGADNESLPEGTRLVLNPSSLSSGYIAWWLGKVEGEVMQLLSLGPVDPSKLAPVNSGSVPPGKKEASGRGWEAQASVDAITQGDVPLNLNYKASSLGGMKLLLNLAGEIAVGLYENPKRAYPVVELAVDYYQHKEWGKVYTPVMAIVGWLDEDGNPVNDLKKLI